MKYKLSLIILLASIILAGCEEEVKLTTEEYEQMLVVDGTITNEPGPYTVKLSLSTPVDESKLKPYTGCIVTIFEEARLDTPIA